ncbi:MAG: TRAP transporter small permease [Proteobacteria bacterium]|nr:TRAP transporter small permease [Pseudomonadota bacterium]
MTENATGSLVKLSERATTWLARGGSVGLAAMMFLTLFDVVGRAFDHPIVGTVELTELIMGTMIYLGVGYTTFYRGHIRVDILITALRPRVQAILDFFTIAIGVGFIATITWQLFIKAQSRFTNGDVTSIWELPDWPVAYVMAIGSILMATSLILHLILTARSIATGKPYSVGKPSELIG